MSQQPRRINTNRAHSADSTRPAAAHSSAGQGRTVRRPRKKKKRIRWWIPLLVVLVIIALAAAYVLHYVSQLLNSVAPDENAVSIAEEVQTAEEYKGDVVGILVCGIDYEEGRTYSDASSNDGMTDMIMYMQFDVKNNKVNMLQIPRNTLVGSKIELESGKTYKSSNGQINAVALSNTDGIAALAAVIQNNYKLPVDYYVTIDMQAFAEVVDRFGGIEVYVPRTISYGGSTLEPGYHNLLGDAAEFFVRNRKGAGYENSDIDRLNMQRYFYSGLFKRIRTMTARDIIKLMPVIMNDYITTNCDLKTIISLALSFLKVDSGSIMLCQTPVFMDCSYYNNNSIVAADKAAVAELLNGYFREYTGPVDASALNILDWERRGGASTSANVQYVGQLDNEANAAIEGGQSDVEGAVTTDEVAAG